MKTSRTLLLLNVLGLFVFSETMFTGCSKPQPLFHYDFESDADLDAIPWQCRLIFSLTKDHATSGKQSLKMSYYPDQPGAKTGYPGLSLLGFDPDWHKAKLLCADIFNPSSEHLVMGLRVDDRPEPPFEERFNTELDLQPGLNLIKVPLENLVTSHAQQKRKLNFRRIQSVSLFFIKPESSLSVFVDNIRLE